MTAQGKLFADTLADGVVAINGRCVVRSVDTHRVVLVAGIPIAQYTIGDRMAQAYAMVSLVDQGWADQVEVAQGFGATSRTVRRYQRRFEEGGLMALGRPSGFPSGQSRVGTDRERLVSRLRADGFSNRDIALKVGVNEKAIRKLLARLGFRAPRAEQQTLGLPADPNLSAPARSSVEPPAMTPALPADPNLSAPATSSVGATAPPLAPSADPNLFGRPPEVPRLDATRAGHEVTVARE